jgi:hypothetical protein
LDFDLKKSSSGNSSWMLNNDVFSRAGVRGTSFNDLMRAAGYEFEGWWESSENISWRVTSVGADVTASIYQQFDSLFLSEGSRENTRSDFRETDITKRSAASPKAASPMTPP